MDNGKPWKLDPFQLVFLEDLFAGLKVCWLVVPEENGKSTFMAGIALYYLEHLPNAGIPVAASSKEQADAIYSQAEGFVMRSPRLSELVPDLVLEAKGLRQQNSWQRKDVPRFQCQEGLRRIKFFRGGRLQIRAADDKRSDGIIPAGVLLIDELHAHQNLKLYRTWMGKLDKRGAQLLVISTAGEPGSEFEDEREEIRQSSESVTRDGCFTRAVGPERVLHDWSIQEDGDPDDLELVARANPATRITAATLARKKERFGNSAGAKANWRRRTCNLPTRSTFAAISEADFFAAATDERIPDGTPIWLGLDLGWVSDTTALMPFWYRSKENRLFGPAVILEPPGGGVQMEPYKVEVALTEIHNRTPIDTVVMDPTHGETLAAWIESNLGARVVKRTQNLKSQIEDYNQFMEALRQGWLKHAGDRGFTRHAMNALGRLLPGGDTKFDRPSESRNAENQGRRVIDALVAAAMVNAVASMNKPSVYASRGIVSIADEPEKEAA